MGLKGVLLSFQISAVFFLVLMLVLSPTIGHCAYTKVWYVHDVINPSLDEVKWSEEGAIAEPPSWIADGMWSQASMRESLVNANDIFVSTYEQFSWRLLRPIAEYSYGTTFNSFQDFETSLNNDTGRWLTLSWNIDTGWYGVSSNTTKVKTSFNETTSVAELWAWFHITRIPEYVVGEGTLENWLTGFDLTPISTGSLKLWEFYRDFSTNASTYSLRFEAPANILFQHGDNFTFNIGVSSYYNGYTFRIQQAVEINMPPNTDIMETSPSNMSVHKANTASFVIARGDTYPASFTVVSGPPAKSLGQSISEGASLWLFTPGGWAAIASLLVLSYTGLRGRRIWHRNRLYHRLYNSMVTLFDLYSKNLTKFHQEMDNISGSVIKTLIEDKITDDQFEKLLKRRDDLIERSEKQELSRSSET